MTRLSVLTVALSLFVRAAGHGLCIGDCDTNDQVAVNELVRGVNIALGQAAVTQCASLDSDGNDRVTVNELVSAVTRALRGCAFGPLSVEGDVLCFAGSVAAEFAPLSLRVATAEGEWRASAPSWITLQPAQGAAPSTIAVTANTAGLPDGAYQDVIRFTDGGGRPIDIAVDLQLHSPGVTEGWRLQAIEPVGLDRVNTTLAIAPDDHVGIAFHRDAGTVNRTLRLVEQIDCRWQGASVEMHGTDPSLAFDAAGDPHLAFFGSRALTLRYGVRRDGTWNFTTVDQEGPGGATGHLPSLALDSTGAPHISYLLKFVEGQIFTYDLRYARLADGAWQRETVDAEHQTGWDSNLALTADDQPRIVYHDNGTNELKFAEWLDDHWNIEVVGRGGRPAQIRLDQDAVPHVAYHVPPNLATLMYAVRAEQWINDTIEVQGQSPLGGTHASVALALDSAGQPVIAYVDYVTNSLKLARISDGEGWVIDVVDQGPNLGDYCSLQLDRDDVPHVSYLDFQRGVLKYAVGPPVRPR